MQTKIEKIIKFTCETYKVNDNLMAVEYDNEQGKKESFFISLNEYKERSEQEPYDAIMACKKYYYFLPTFINNFKGFYYKNAFEDYYKNSIPSFEVIEQEGFNQENLLYLDGSSYLVYRFGDDLPLSLPYFVDYIDGSITDKYFDLIRAKNILANNPIVTELKEKNIPYYNKDCGHTALEFYVRLPQDIFDKLVTHHREINKKFWSCDVKRGFGLHAMYENKNINLDVLGLKEAYLGEPSQKDDDG